MLMSSSTGSPHFLFLATNGMDLGSTSMIYGWRGAGPADPRMITGLRMNHNFIRVGGTAADLPDGWQARLTETSTPSPSGWRSTRS